MSERASWPMRGWEVRAILDGRKTQARRIVKPHPDNYSAMQPEQRTERGWTFMAHSDKPGYAFATGDVQCPYGVPGDLLWVRETWQAFFADEVPANRLRGPRHTMGIPAHPERESFVFYRADGEISHPDMGEARWRSPLHMPRWASRITLEIVSVRVERLQEISEADAIAEGSQTPGEFLPPSCRQAAFSEQQVFARLWDSINAKRAPWASNPWVWVIEFKREGK